jgi:anti-sigma-K factor RskA
MTEKMRCEQVDELAAAYALYAASPEEVAAIENHLSGCDKHPGVADLVATARRLAALPDEMEPPAELKTRLMAAVNADLAAERTAPVPLTSVEAPTRGWLGKLFGSPRGGFVLVGAAAAIAVVVLTVLVLPPGPRGHSYTTVREFQTDGISGELTYVRGQETAVLEVEGLDPAPDGQTYQVWAITDGQPVSIGFLEVPAEGVASSDMDVELTRGQTVAVTVEPDGGSPQPTTEPVFGVDI